MNNGYRTGIKKFPCIPNLTLMCLILVFISNTPSVQVIPNITRERISLLETTEHPRSTLTHSWMFLKPDANSGFRTYLILEEDLATALKDKMAESRLISRRGFRGGGGLIKPKLWKSLKA